MTCSLTKVFRNLTRLVGTIFRTIPQKVITKGNIHHRQQNCFIGKVKHDH